MQFHPVVQALIATLFTWFVTAVGASFVLFSKNFSQKILDGLLGMAAGVMIAASFWSLLDPAIDMSGGSWIPATTGFFFGGLFLYIFDKIIPHLHFGVELTNAEGSARMFVCAGGGRCGNSARFGRRDHGRSRLGHAPDQR